LNLRLAALMTPASPRFVELAAFGKARLGHIGAIFEQIYESAIGLTEADSMVQDGGQYAVEIKGSAPQCLEQVADCVRTPPSLWILLTHRP
jgi:hypothetical protein